MLLTTCAIKWHHPNLRPAHWIEPHCHTAPLHYLSSLSLPGNIGCSAFTVNCSVLNKCLCLCLCIWHIDINCRTRWRLWLKITSRSTVTTSSEIQYYSVTTRIHLRSLSPVCTRISRTLRLPKHCSWRSGLLWNMLVLLYVLVACFDRNKLLTLNSNLKCCQLVWCHFIYNCKI